MREVDFCVGTNGAGNGSQYYRSVNSHHSSALNGKHKSNLPHVLTGQWHVVILYSVFVEDKATITLTSCGHCLSLSLRRVKWASGTRYPTIENPHLSFIFFFLFICFFSRPQGTNRWAPFLFSIYSCNMFIFNSHSPRCRFMIFVSHIHIFIVIVTHSPTPSHHRISRVSFNFSCDAGGYFKFQMAMLISTSLYSSFILSHCPSVPLSCFLVSAFHSTWIACSNTNTQNVWKIRRAIRCKSSKVDRNTWLKIYTAVGTLYWAQQYKAFGFLAA